MLYTYSMNLLKKKQVKRRIYSKPVLIVLLILLFFVAKAVWNAYEKASIARANVVTAQRELDELEIRYTEVEQDLKRFDTEEGIEAEIRSTYGLAREGEQVIIIVDEEENASTTMEEIQKRSFWQIIKDIF